MIPRANITAWRIHAPWPSDEQVEQDLVLSRALVEIFRQEVVADLANKLKSDVFLEGIGLLIPADSEYNVFEAAAVVQDELIAKLPGDSWKGSES